MEAGCCVGVVWPGPYTRGDFDEVNRFMPAGVTMRMVEAGSGDQGEITLENVLELPENHNIERAANELVPLGVSAIAYACTSGSYVRGVGGDRDIADRISTATGAPATTTSSATISALRELGVTRVAVLSPHVDELNDRLGRFLEDSGFHVVRMKGLNKGGGIDLIAPGTTRETVVREVDCREADGVFISCTSMRTASILEEMERTIDKPVVAATQATAWELLCLAGASERMAGLGRLFKEVGCARID